MRSSARAFASIHQRAVMLLGGTTPAIAAATAGRCSARRQMRASLPHAVRLPRHASSRRFDQRGRAQCMLQTSSGASSSALSPKDEARTARLKKLFDGLPGASDAAGGAGSAATYEGLLRADRAWEALRNAKTGEAAGPPPEFVRTISAPLPKAAQFDVVVAGGTLGIFYAAALQLRGVRCAVVERGPLRGRQQEWNISRKELFEMVHLGVLSAAEAESCISVEFNPGRCGFHGGPSVFVTDVLNLGVSPDRLLSLARARFEALGGSVFENTALAGIDVHSDGVRLNVGPGSEGEGITGRLVLDAMGNASPAVRQARWGKRPDGVCMVVGTCARGFPEDPTGDIIFTAGDIAPEMRAQLFWEAFPAGSGPRDRTTYLFTYVDADPARPSLAALLDEYLAALPGYQGVALEQLSVQRVLFGVFPTFCDSPLRPLADRLLQVGDASGIQSPLSFGGFGAVCRHLGRLSDGVADALAAGALDRAALGALNAYQPNLSSAWMFQRAMSVPPGTRPQAGFINALLAENFANMERLGDPVLKPFLQDVVQFVPLARALLATMLSRPTLIPQILVHVGPFALADWLVHFLLLGAYTLASAAAAPVLGALLKAGALGGLSERRRCAAPGHQCTADQWRSALTTQPSLRTTTEDPCLSRNA